jgi:hypothetical protein
MEGTARVHQEIITEGQPNAFTVVKTILYSDGEIGIMVTEVDTDKGKNETVNLSPAVLAHVMWKRRGLKSYWTREKYRKARVERRQALQEANSGKSV